MQIPVDVRTCAERQNSFVTVAQLNCLGVTAPQRAQLRRAGALQLIRRGLYSTDPGAMTFRRVVAAACVNRHGPAASGLTAAHFWGLWREPDRPELTIRYPRQLAIQGVDVCRSRDLARTDVTTIDNIPVTTPTRTFVDLGRILPAPQVERLLDHALATGIVALGRLQQIRIDRGRQGRNGAGVLGQILERLSPAGTRHDSGPELKLFRLLTESKLPEPEVQWPVVVDGRLYRFDLAYPSAMLALEYDGADWHSTPGQRRGDEARQSDCERAGWTFIRLTKEDLYSPVQYGVVRRIAEALRRHSNVDVA